MERHHLHAKTDAQDGHAWSVIECDEQRSFKALAVGVNGGDRLVRRCAEGLGARVVAARKDDAIDSIEQAQQIGDAGIGRREPDGDASGGFDGVAIGSIAEDALAVG